VLNIWNLNESDLGKLNKNQIKGLEAVPKWMAEKMAAGKEENIGGMIEHDYNGIELTTKTNQFAPGQYVLVRALVMPGKYDWSPIKAINELENNKIGADFWDKFHELIVLEEDNPEFWSRFRKQIERTMKEYPYNLEDILDMEIFRAKGRKKAQLKLAKDPLSKYKSKRNETPEPEGKIEEGKNKHRFVIQRHKAKKAGEHFDLRLENDQGAMSSWSIPKHKLPKGKEKLLAVKTEDHPISYMKFKGEIPEGEYGAGKVEIYDSGTYDDISWSGSKIVFKLKGKKEKSAYKIFKTNGNKWMIMEAKEDDLEKKAFLLSKLAAKYTKEEYEILLESARERRKMFRIMKREQERLRELGLDPVCVSSTAAGVNIPGMSDIDFQVGTDDVEETSRMLTEAGIPFSNVKEGAYVEHTYETPEGISIDLKVRPKEHVKYQLKGLKRILDAPIEERHRQILEKYRALQEGDIERYKEVKLDLYKKHRLMPPDADWSKIKAF
jgi:DNA ligase D-like protein (predicted 3'-phosphoesterase)